MKSWSDTKKINLILFIAFALCAIGSITAEKYLNNFLIFTHSSAHFFDLKSLYSLYSEEYHDYFLYGPVFPVLITPFAFIPIEIGKIVWAILNFTIYAYSIKKLFGNQFVFYFVWIVLCFQDIYLSGLSYEINNLMVAIVILAFILIREQRELLSGFIIGFFTMIKIFPIVGLLFCSFRQIKKTYIVGICIGILVAIVIPLVCSNFNYTLFSFKQWIEVLIHKDMINRQLNPMVDYSFPGMVRKISQNPTISSIYFLLFGLIVALILFVKNWKYHNLEYELLAFSILSILVFNSNSESPSFIISSTAVMIWWNFVEKTKTKWSWGLIILYFTFSTIPTIDIYPKYIRDEFLHKLSLRALPPTLIWFYIVFHALKKPKLAFEFKQ